VDKLIARASRRLHGRADDHPRAHRREAADLVTSDIDDNDKPFLTGERTIEGFYKTRNGLDQAISRGLAYAAYADMVWCETGKPDLAFARQFAEAIQAKYPARCSPTTARLRSTGRRTSTTRRRQVPARARRDGLQVPVHHARGFHSLNYSMFNLAHGYANSR
jgi:isocitrate lyase